MCMPSININVQDIFTPLLSINADIKTIKLSVGLYIECFSLWEQIILVNVLAISGNGTARLKTLKERRKNALMKMRQTHPLWSGTNVPTKQIINSCNHKRTAMYTLNDLKMLLICYSKNYRYTHQDNARLYHVSQTCSYISEGRLTSRCSRKGRKSF